MNTTELAKVHPSEVVIALLSIAAIDGFENEEMSVGDMFITYEIPDADAQIALRAGLAVAPKLDPQVVMESWKLFDVGLVPLAIGLLAPHIAKAQETLIDADDGFIFGETYRITQQFPDSVADMTAEDGQGRLIHIPSGVLSLVTTALHRMG